ncbi:mandelate racemase/muconate lactonizing enzyme family protein [Parapusillimonas granuli]|uniref:Mandelate racemase/muconate lactonizing enzyme family protein n=1 Tax=Parapusillimonas granuli TaxID=380911 RepID=A0A853FU40_9BURK|nr:mandelate racemase/muconate lactonizing enzyme family protein [Parapusillimonas granuli]
MRIRDLRAYPVSVPVPAGSGVTLGVGRAVKRDAVIVKVTTDCGLVGYGESHHGRAHTTIAHFINTALRDMALGHDAGDTVGIWRRIYERQVRGMGLGAACVLAMSGLDMALWDIRGKAAGLPLYRLLGGSSRPLAAYAGGVALGWQEPDSLVQEASGHVERGYTAIKLRIGDRVERDLARVAAVRKALGDGVRIMTDAMMAYSLEDAARAMPALDELNVGWLEEPFAPHDYRSYELARPFGKLPFAAGENHYTRFEFTRLIDDRVVSVLQPDLSKAGGLTECLRIAAMASAYHLPVHPHISMTGINMAATVHFLCAVDNPGYFEADASRNNLLRDELVHAPYALDGNGCVRPLEAPGIGVEVDEEFLLKHPPIEGPAYVQ